MNHRWYVHVDDLPCGSRVVAPRRVLGNGTAEYGPQVIVDPPALVMRLCGDSLERRVKLARARARDWCEERNAIERGTR